MKITFDISHDLFSELEKTNKIFVGYRNSQGQIMTLTATSIYQRPLSKALNYIGKHIPGIAIAGFSFIALGTVLLSISAHKRKEVNDTLMRFEKCWNEYLSDISNGRLSIVTINRLYAVVTSMIEINDKYDNKLFKNINSDVYLNVLNVLYLCTIKLNDSCDKKYSEIKAPTVYENKPLGMMVYYLSKQNRIMLEL